MERAYLQYKAEDFLQDSFFIQWMNGDQQAAEFWEEWIKNHPEKREEIEKARALFSELSFREPEIQHSAKEKLWSQIASKTVDTHDRSRIKSKRSWVSIAGYAAMLALLVIAAVYFWPRSEMNFETQLAEMEQLKLPDRSKVVLNANSKLSYRASDEARLITLNGEGYFDVKEGKRFQVESAHGIVTVLGTSFNIYDREDRYEVVCVSGRVHVDLKDNGSYTLTKGEFVHLTAEGQIETNDDTGQFIDSDRSIAWKEGEFFYKDVRLETVMKEVERQFDVDIHMDNGIRDKEGAFYFTNEELDQALQNILWPLHLTYSRDGRDIYIKK